MSSSGYSISGLVLSILGVTGIVDFVYRAIKKRLPSEKLKLLHEILHETHASFGAVLEEGLPFDRKFVRDTESQLRRLQSLTDEARAHVHTATTFWRQFRSMLGGLSRKISEVTDEVALLRAEISNTSELERKKLEEQGLASRPPLPTRVHRTPRLGLPLPSNRFGHSPAEQSVYARPATSARRLRPEAFVTGDHALVASGVDGVQPINANDTAGTVHSMNVSIGEEQIELQVFNSEPENLASPMTPDVVLSEPQTSAPGTSVDVDTGTSPAPASGSPSVPPARPAVIDIHELNTVLGQLTGNVVRLAKSLDQQDSAPTPAALQTDPRD